ncbi:unnamed protein product [Clonostachys rosea f. rosea IK726]|uniref:Uncharacterized protein n=1 Tax=Clonostachys rosea f. rosea IK726 TaxID=1349383 RepID=A0ACA9TME5_BIOOC|nr:unnamed protein product [Clonostachys rosea f. rosea IK726]
MASPCFFRVESPYQPMADGFSDGGGWFLAGDDEIAVSPYDETFPKRELFEDVNLSNIPLSMLNGDANIDPAELSATDRFGGGFLGQDDESPVQPLFETQASTAAFMPKQEQFQPTPPGNTQGITSESRRGRQQEAQGQAEDAEAGSLLGDGSLDATCHDDDDSRPGQEGPK